MSDMINTELRDSICREMFECGYAALTDPIKRELVDSRLRQVTDQPSSAASEPTAEDVRRLVEAALGIIHAHNPSTSVAQTDAVIELYAALHPFPRMTK